MTFEKENISTFATCRAKHSKLVCKKYYIQHFSQREAGRILRSCYSMYRTRADPKKVVKMREKVITKADMATTDQFRKCASEIVNKIKHMTNITIKKTRLMKELEKLALHEDGCSFHTFLQISLIRCIYTSFYLNQCPWKYYLKYDYDNTNKLSQIFKFIWKIT